MNTPQAEPTETVQVCRICLRCLGPSGEWIHVRDFSDFLYVLKYFLAEHAVCPKCSNGTQKGVTENAAIV